MARPRKDANIDYEMIGRLYKSGCTDEQVSIALGVTRTTLSNWKNDNPKFFDTLKWKDYADGQVERSLFERATGYNYKAEHINVYEGRVTVTPYNKHCPPDPTSMIFWLKNRNKAEWRDKVEAGEDLNEHVDVNMLKKEINKLVKDNGFHDPDE